MKLIDVDKAKLKLHTQFSNELFTVFDLDEFFDKFCPEVGVKIELSEKKEEE